jgi:ATP-dependent helicase/nuclease subunit A
MLPNQLDIYKASAGSGKTYLLTSQYLKLLFHSTNNFRHILAVTFTNKATAEMKERILSVLRDIAEGKSDSSYVSLLMDYLQENDFGKLQQQARAIYKSILHDYSRFSVSTIDSFVQRIIRSFAFEMGMDAGFRLQLKADQVKEALADKLFKLLDTDHDLQRWVADLALQRLEEGKSWNFRDEMIALSGEIFREEFQEFEQAMRAIPDVHAAFKSLQQKVYTIVRSFEKQWREMGQEALELLQSQGLGADDFYYKKSGFINYFFKAATGIIEEPGARVQAVLDDPATMEGKKFNATVDVIRMSLHRMLQRLADFYTGNIGEYQTAKAIARNLGFLRLMKVFSEQLAIYRAENNMLLISDTHLLLRELTKETDASFIYEKTGNRYKHFLIDEFQDTSGFQWNNFRPLVNNTLGEGNYNLLVGDIKQAIYRWRSGDWELLHRKASEHLAPHQINLSSLQDNHRSARPIIEFNNFLYKMAPYMLQEAFNATASKAYPQVREALREAGYFDIIRMAYNESHQQLAPTSSLGGFVHIEFLEGTESADGDALKFKEQVLPLIHQTIVDLLQQGFQPNDIAILTRENKEATLVVNHLMGEMQTHGSTTYALISADALLIRNNAAIRIIIAALQWMLGKDGKISLVELRQAYASYRGDENYSTQIFLSRPEEEQMLPDAFVHAIEALRHMSLADAVNELIRIFELHKKNEHAAYLLAFQDLLQQWIRYGNEGLLSFLDYWEEEGRDTSLPENSKANAVNVLTIHKSKGLAFNILIIPFLTWNITSSKTQLWVHTEGTKFDDVPVVAVPCSEDLSKGDFAFRRYQNPGSNEYKDEGYFPEKLLTLMDNLNLLYVATTRARRRIIGWAPKPAKEAELDKIASIDKLLFAIATMDIPSVVFEGMSDADKEIYQHVQFEYNADDAVWHYGKDELKQEQKEVEPVLLMPPLTQADWRTNLEMRFKPLQTEQQENEQLPRTIGTLLHEALALLQHPSYIDKTIRYMAQKGLMTESQQSHATQTLERIIQQPVMQLWKEDKMMVLKEKDILTKERLLRRPDLVLYNNEQTIVIDFKFAEPTDANTQTYCNQINEYVQLLRQMSFSQVRGKLMFVTDDDIKIIEVN